MTALNKGDATIRWGRSEDRHVVSKCERYSISPEFLGRLNSQQYDVSGPAGRIGTRYTQSEGKALAQLWKDKKDPK